MRELHALDSRGSHSKGIEAEFGMSPVSADIGPVEWSEEKAIGGTLSASDISGLGVVSLTYSPPGLRHPPICQ